MKLFPNWSVDREIAEPFSSQSTVCCNMKLEMYSRLCTLYFIFCTLYSVFFFFMLTLTVLSHLCSLPACDGDQPPVRGGTSHTSVTCHTLRHTLRNNIRHTLCHILRQVRLSRARLDSEFFSQMRFFTTITWHFQNWENMKYDQNEHFFLYERIYHLPGEFFFTFWGCYISLLFRTVEVVFKGLKYWNTFEISSSDDYCYFQF